MTSVRVGAFEVLQAEEEEEGHDPTAVPVATAVHSIDDDSKVEVSLNDNVTVKGDKLVQTVTKLRTEKASEFLFSPGSAACADVRLCVIVQSRASRSTTTSCCS